MTNTTTQSRPAAEPLEPIRRNRVRGCGLVFFAIMLIVAAGVGGGLGWFLSLLDQAQGELTVLEDYRPKVGSRVYGANREYLGEFTGEARRLVPLSQMPLHLQKAFVATEDDRFYQHLGVRPESIMRAVYEAYVHDERMRGASTITQQIVRNIEPLPVGQERTIKRKFDEMILAMQMEREYTKDEILELYLNVIFLGISAYGVEAASQQYFGKSCTELTLDEAALLAGLPRAPNRNNPIASPENARQRRDIVLRQMLANGFITREEFEEATAIAVESKVLSGAERAERMEAGEGVYIPNRFLAPYFVEEVRRTIINEGIADWEELKQNGMEVHTTVDMRLQRAAGEVLRAHLDAFDANKREYLEARGRLDEFTPVSGGLICIDNRPGYQGLVRAMVGGRDFFAQQFNTVTQAKRQPGSSIKPFVWLAAMDQLSYTPSTTIVDEPVTWFDALGRPWSPRNFGNDYAHGPVTLRRALEGSVNIVSVKLVEELGVPIVRSYLRSAGIRSPIKDVAWLTVGLGTEVVTPLEQCVAYSTLANMGDRYSPVLIKEIRSRDGSLIYDGLEHQDIELDAIPADVAYQITYLLEGVATWGTGHRSKELGRPRAGKTGTSNDNIDVWFCGYTPYFTTVVWIGYRDNRPLGSGRNYTGGRLACPLWTDFMVKAHQGLPEKDFEAPPEVRDRVRRIGVDRETGIEGGSFPEVFIRGTRPPIEPPPEPEPGIEGIDAPMEQHLLAEW
jgi:penicillin-binding protein 1A